MDKPLFLRNLWYFAVHGSHLAAGSIRPIEMLGEKLVLGRGKDGKPFALKNNCPHRGIPLSEGSFDGETLQCCYHGWKFDTCGVCKEVPALSESSMDVGRIKVFAYPCREIHGTIWIYMPDGKPDLAAAERNLPDLMIPATESFRLVETVRLPVDIDHATVGLIDPAHVTYVHQSWFWQSGKNPRRKEKHFEPYRKGFRMKRHTPSNGKGYGILKGGTSTEIDFQIPAQRLEHITVGEKDEIVSVTILTPINENVTELNHVFYSTLGFINYLWWPLATLGRAFIGQDLGVFQKLADGLKTKPPLMLLGDPDAQARWYFALKRQWQLSQETQTEFVNTIAPATLKWRS